MYSYENKRQIDRQKERQEGGLLSNWFEWFNMNNAKTNQLIN